MNGPPRALQISARVPGASSSSAVDFLIPGLDGLHFVAYGSTQGSVVVACARQVDQIGSVQHKTGEQQHEQMQTLLVLDLQQPAAGVAAATSVSLSNTHLNVSSSTKSGLLPAPEWSPEPLNEPVLHVAFGGGPHLLLAACTRVTLSVISLEGLAAHLFQQQTSGVASGTGVGQHALWHQLAAVHCGHAELLAISWTQQLDGILTSSTDGLLTMWEMRPLRSTTQQTQLLQQVAGGNTSVPAAAAALRAAWSVRAPVPQRLICAGVSIYAPSATAAGQSASASLCAGSITVSPLKSRAGTPGSSTSSPSRDAGEADRYASVWWPQIREQRQRHYAGGMPAVGQEKLRHPAAVIGLQWSPGVLQKDALSSSAPGANDTSSAGPGSPSWTSGTEPGSPTTAAAVAATEAEDHPALMTHTEDGTVRVWVETLVLTESCGGSPLPAARPGPAAAHLQRRSSSRSPGTGSPGAAPSSPRDARAAAAAAAALGAAAPAITSYFCMALLIDSAATAVGAAAAAAAAASALRGTAGGGTTQAARPHVALWARHAGPLLLHKQQRRVAAPVLWLFTATIESRAGGSSCRLLMHLHAVRGLAAIVMSAGYGGSLSSTSGGSSSTRPAAVLWGQHSWDVPIAAVGTNLLLLLQRLCCWVSDEEGYPLLHAFTSSRSDSSGRLVMAGRTFATVQEDGPMMGQVHKQLAVVSTWQADAVAHEQLITAFAATGSCISSGGGSGGNGGCGSRNGSSGLDLVASCDGGGTLLIWSGPRLQHLAAVTAAAVGSLASLVWLPLEGRMAQCLAPSEEGMQQPQQQQQQQQWLAVGCGSMLQCYAVSSKQAVAVATAALPAGCTNIGSLHTLEDDSNSSSCLLAAVCSASARRGNMVCVWRCAAAPQATRAGGMQLQLVGTVQVPGTAAAITAAATASSTQLLVGKADGAVLLLTVVVDNLGVQLLRVACLQEDGSVSAVSADQRCLHIASAHQTGVSVWSAVADSSGADADSTWHYSRAATVALPLEAGTCTAVAWLGHAVAPCLAVASSTSTLFLLSMVRNESSSSSQWEWLAQLPKAVGGGASGTMRLAAGSACSTVLAAAGNQLLRLSDSVLVPSGDASGQQGGGTKLLGKLLLESAGPLPQYHPNFLAALLLAGKHTVAAAVLVRLVSWLASLQAQAQASLADAATVQPPSPGMHVAGQGVADGVQAGDVPAPSFAGLPLAEILDTQLMQLSALLERAGAVAGTTTGIKSLLSQPPAQHRAQLASRASTGLLDMAAFGMAPPPAAEPAPQQQQQAGAHLASGMLDMSAFGMAPPLAAEAAPQPAGGNFASGVLDMAAFGISPPPAVAPLLQQQAGGDFASGMLDLAAFSMPPPVAAEAAQLRQHQAGSDFSSGMLDLGSFGMAPPPAVEPVRQQQQQPGSEVGSGMLDLAAFGSTSQQYTGTAGSTSSADVPISGQAASSTPLVSQQWRRPLAPPQQPSLAAHRLLPVSNECYQQLRALLLPPSASNEGEEDATSSGNGGGPRGAHLPGAASLQHLLPQPAKFAEGVQAVAIAIPGLSLAETSSVLSIAGAFSAAAARIDSIGSSSSSSVDMAAAHFVTAVSLACAVGGRGEHGTASQQPEQQQPQRVTVMNAAGVAYTLAPSAILGGGQASSSNEATCVGQQWGLLPGLDATSVVWALLSGTEEVMLQQALQRVQLLETAASAAAAAAESSDAATFLATRTARSDQPLDLVSSWVQLRQLGAGFWLRDTRMLASLAERLAKQQFAARRNADDCALLYCALGKRSVLQGLYRSTQNRKLSDFLSRDFREEQHQQAAQKNAFVLMGQHRHELAAAFFIVGGTPDAAIGVAAHDMRDPQLALVLCRLVYGKAGTAAELRLLQELRKKSEAGDSSDAAAAAAACCWLLADADAAVELMLRAERAKLRSAATAEHAAQLLPLLHLLLTANPPHKALQQASWQRQLCHCLCALAAALQGCGLHALAVQAAIAARLDQVNSKAGRSGQQHEMLEQLLSTALLPGMVSAHERGQHHLDADAAYQLELLQRQGVIVNVPAILARLRRMQRGVMTAGQHFQPACSLLQPLGQRRSLERQHSSGGSSYRSRDSEQARQQQQQRQGTTVVGEGQVLFRVDNDKVEAVACCALMSPDVLGRPVVVASHRHGLVEGQLHVVPPELLSPLQEAPDSPDAAAVILQEEQQQRGGVFGRLISQLFDQSTWQQDPTWHHGTAEFDVVGSAAEAPGSSGSPLGVVRASSVHSTALAAHPHKQLYLTGCSSGRLHLWQFGEQQSLATYTPVPGSELANITRSFSGLLSFSRSFKQSTAAPRLANWGKAAAVRFAPSGERFAAVGEGGVVATWRLDAPTRQADGDGHGCAEWWHQALSKQGCAVDFVGGSSSVLVVGGRCQPASTTSIGASSNLSVWDTMAPAASSCVGRLSHHQAGTVTALAMLPGGWLLAAGDGEGGLSCTDLRMMGASTGPRLLWSVKAARGSLRSIVAIPSNLGGSAMAGLQLGRGGSASLLATAAADGAVRIWRGSDGRLLQSIEAAHFSSRPSSAGSRRSSYDGGVPLSPNSTSNAPLGSHPLPVTGLALSEEGLVSVGADGCVRLFSFLL